MPTAALAFITTIHCAIALLRKYRPRERAPLVLAPSILFIISPWYLSSPAWLAIALASHVSWFIACEKLMPAKRVAPPGFVTVPVLGTFVQTPEIRSFRLKRPAGFAFKPGQFLMVRVPVNGKPAVRCYSITSTPSCRGYLEISVRNQGVVSRHLHERLVSGATMDVRGPGGTFVYPDGNRPIVLVAGGIGITPLLSMLRHGVETQPDRSITLLLSVRTAADVPFARDLELYSTRHPNVRVVIALTGGSRDPRYLSGRLDRHALGTLLRSVGDCVYMLCGPLAMIDAMKSTLESMGVSPSQIHFEKFETAVAGAANASGQEAWVTLNQSGHKVKTAAGQTILDVCEGAGAPVPSMCRVGVCGTCRMQLLAGDVAGDFDGLDESDRASGYILPCVALPLSDCVVDA